MALSKPEFDVAIVGGGPGGLSAALILGRARKRVVVFDSGVRRNLRAEHLHGFVTRDGIAPAEFRAIAREQLAPYDVTFRADRVSDVASLGDGFRVFLEDGRDVTARRVVLAMGVVDQPLPIPGMSDAWGRSVFQCPHCHGWENRDRRWGVLVQDDLLADFSVMLKGWTSDVTAFTLGQYEIPAEVRARMSEAEVKVETGTISRLRVLPSGALEGIELADGQVLPVEVLFTKPKQQLPPLVEALGLALNELGYVKVNERQETTLPGMYAIGDLVTPAQASMVAAYTGSLAGWMLVHALNVRTHPKAA